jgi:hypothetical protein
VKKHIVEILVYTGLLILIVIQTLLGLITEYVEHDAILSPKR